MKLETYEQYKNSGIEWLGEIPIHWGVKRVKDLTDTQSGTTPSSGNPNYYEDGIYYWVRTTDLNNSLVTSAEYKITELAKKDFNLKVIPTDSVLLAMYGGMGTIGKNGILKTTSTINQSVCAVLPAPRKFSSEYFFYYLKYFRQKWILFADSARKAPNINQDAIKNLFFTFPPISEQNHIAAYLDRQTTLIDKKINLLQLKVDKYQELKKAVINETVCQGLDKNVPMKDSGVEWIGEIPTHWKTRRIKNVANIFGRIGYRGYTVADIVSEGKGAITLSPSNIIDQKLNLKKKTFISFFKYEESPEIKVEENDVILVKTASVGKATIIKELSEKATINPQLVVFKNYKIQRDFLYYSVISKVIQVQIGQDLFGGVVNTITQAVISNYFLFVPSLDEQKKIVEYLKQKTSEIEAILKNIQEQIEKLKELRITLINDIVTGKLKVATP